MSMRKRAAAVRLPPRRRRLPVDPNVVVPLRLRLPLPLPLPLRLLRLLPPAPRRPRLRRPRL